jgi:hypothetical protein
MSTEEIRVELGELLHQNITDSLPVDPTKREIGAQVDTAIDVLLAAGYRKPQQVATAEELDALPPGSVVLSASYMSQNDQRISFQRWDDGDWHRGARCGSTHPDNFLPVTVLHVGATE